MARRKRKRKLSPVGSALTIVLVGSAIALLLPSGWTDKLFSASQVFVPMQDVTSGALQSVRAKLPSADTPVTRAEYDALARSEAALQHRAASLGVRTAQLEKQVELLTATRSRSVDGGRIGARGRLVPARVLTEDLLPWRESRLITAGSGSGAVEGAAIISNHFSIEPVEVEGLHPGLAVVLGETFVGVVEQAGQFTSRVRLLSDPDSEMKVKIGRLTDDGFRVIERYFWLKGRGSGVMEVRDIEAKFVEEGLVDVGDWVLSDPLDPSLPSAMVIGRVAKAEKDRSEPLHAILTVASEVPNRRITDVYVYDPREQVASDSP